MNRNSTAKVNYDHRTLRSEYFSMEIHLKSIRTIINEVIENCKRTPKIEERERKDRLTLITFFIISILVYRKCA